MKIREKLFYVFLAVLCGGMFLIRTVFVYGATDEEIDPYLEEGSSDFRPRASLDITTVPYVGEWESEEAKEAWVKSFGSGWNSTAQKTEVCWEPSENTLSNFLQALTINKQPVARLSYDDLKELYPMNNAFFDKRASMKARVRYGKTPDFFCFDFIWGYDQNLLSVVYSDINEEGNFTKIKFDANPEARSSQWYGGFYRRYGMAELYSYYNFGDDGLTRYILGNECYSAEKFMNLNNIVFNAEKEAAKYGENYLEYGECTSDYGKLDIFYVRNADEDSSCVMICFAESNRYDYIVVSDYTVEIKLK